MFIPEAGVYRKYKCEDKGLQNNVGTIPKPKTSLADEIRLCYYQLRNKIKLEKRSNNYILTEILPIIDDKFFCDDLRKGKE